MLLIVFGELLIIGCVGSEIGLFCTILYNKTKSCHSAWSDMEPFGLPVIERLPWFN